MAKGPKKKIETKEEDGLSADDQKLLNSFLKVVEGNLWNVGKGDRDAALSELRTHIIEKSRKWNVDNAIELSIFSVGSPEVIANGIRTLYGYGKGFKAFLILLAFVLAIPTVPYFLAWSIISMVILFYIISHFGMKTNILVGGLMGFSAALSRGITVLLLVAFNPTDLTLSIHKEATDLVLGGTQALIDFMIVSMFLVLAGLLAGHIKEKAVKAYLDMETFAT